MTETPGPRRSTRAASTRAGSATPAPSVAGRRTRARTPKAAPLPAVPTATSHAYGASGKVSLDRQINLSGVEGGFADAFDANRDAALDRDEYEDEHETNAHAAMPPPRHNSTALSSASAATAAVKDSHRAAPAPLQSRSLQRKEEEEHEEEDEDGGEDGEGRDEDVEDEGLRDGDQQYEENHFADESIVHGPNYDSDIDYDDDEEADLLEALPTAPKTGTKPKGSAYLDLTDLHTSFSYTESIAAHTRPYRTVSLEPPPTREELDAAQPWSIVVLWETILRWAQLITEPLTGSLSSLKNLGLLGLLAFTLLAFLRPKSDVDFTGSDASLYQRATDLLSKPFQHIPLEVPWSRQRVSSDPDLTRRIESLELDVRQIRKEIRSATVQLEQILPEHLMVQKNAATGEWELPANFWAALREKLADEGSSIAWDGFIAANQAKLDDAAHESVQKAASKHSHVISQEMFIERVEHVAGEIASRTTIDMIKSLPPSDKGSKILYNLALTNIARNTELALQTVNYFSYGIGAVVDPYLTSPTYQKQKLNPLQSYAKRWLHKGPKEHAPVKALKRWEEATDCWCAAESTDKGKAQLGVIMPQQIVPTSITIEHIPARGTLDIGSAPREFEVWATNTEAPFLPSPESSRDPGLACTEQPVDGYVCIGKGRYDIHAPNHIQNFGIEAAGVVGPVNKVVVKILNNWGKSYTCLYRVRFHGDQQIRE